MGGSFINRLSMEIKKFMISPIGIPMDILTQKQEQLYGMRKLQHWGMI